MFYTVYKTTNLVNGKVYIGKHQTNDLNDNYLGSGKLLKRAIEKHGIENFVKEVLFVFDSEEDMNDKEAELVTENFCLLDTNYNLCSGGQGGFGYINDFVWDDAKRREHNSKISGVRKFSSEERKLYGSMGGLKTAEKDFYNPRFLGKSHTEEKKLKHSEFMKDRYTGSKNSQYGTMWITNGNENRKIKKVDNIPEGWYKGRK